MNYHVKWVKEMSKKLSLLEFWLEYDSVVPGQTMNELPIHYVIYLDVVLAARTV